MSVLVVFGSTEGHTRHLSEFLAHSLRETGHPTDVSDSASVAVDRLNPNDYDAVLVAASLHVGHYQAAVVEFVRRHHEALNDTPSAFIPSLCRLPAQTRTTGKDSSSASRASYMRPCGDRRPSIMQPGRFAIASMIFSSGWRSSLLRVSAGKRLSCLKTTILLITRP